MAEASKKAVEAARATAAAAAAGVKDLVCLFSSCVLVYIHIYSEMYFVPRILNMVLSCMAEASEKAAERAPATAAAAAAGVADSCVFVQQLYMCVCVYTYIQICIFVPRIVNMVLSCMAEASETAAERAPATAAAAAAGVADSCVFIQQLCVFLSLEY